MTSIFLTQTVKVSKTYNEISERWRQFFEHLLVTESSSYMMYMYWFNQDDMRHADLINLNNIGAQYDINLFTRFIE